MNAYQLKVEKPWGFELILTPPESPVAGKILHIKAGCRLSYQYHDQKEESLTLLSGEALLIGEENGQLTETPMELDKGYFIKPMQKHRLKGVTDCEIMEVSTPETGNTVRLEDDYQRNTETEDDRKKQRNNLNLES
jgi:mannose-6-phosphate isomerase